MYTQPMQSTARQYKPMYDVYVTDVMGTTTPKAEELSQVKGLILGNQGVMQKIQDKLGYKSIDEVASAAEKGSAQKDKNHSEFKEWLKIYDIGAEIGYTEGLLRMNVFSDVKSTLEELTASGATVVVYASGATKTTEAGMKTCGLAQLISKYFSSQQTGAKDSSSSYRNIAAELGVDPSRMVYVADDLPEVQAAVEAGFGRVYLIDRSAKETGEKNGYTIINDYSQIAEQTLAVDNVSAETTVETGESAN